MISIEHKHEMQTYCQYEQIQTTQNLFLFSTNCVSVDIDNMFAFNVVVLLPCLYCTKNEICFAHERHQPRA